MSLKFDRCNETFLEGVLEKSPDGKNTRFLRGSVNLWKRFKNFDNHPPYVLFDGNDPVAFVFATTSKRSKYMNLYDIVTAEGCEGNGYASEIWSCVMYEASLNGMLRLKISCTPESVTWHVRNGLIFWAVDPSGSLRSDQPLMPSRSEQKELRDMIVNNPDIGIPKDQKVLERLRAESLESHGFGPKKTAKVEKAIQEVGKYWLRDSLFEFESTLEDFL